MMLTRRNISLCGCLVLGLFCSISFAQNSIDTSKLGKIVIDGFYFEENLYVQNPFAGNGIGFCVVKATANGHLVDSINASAFEIDLKSMNLKYGDSVKIVILHKNDCKPKLLNTTTHHRKSSFEVTTMKIDTDSILRWTTIKERGKYPYIVEQYRWNKWVKIGEVTGNGSWTENSYEFKVVPHSGENQFRVKQVDYISQPNISRPVKYISNAKELEIQSVDRKKIVLSGESLYEIYDREGNVVKKGFGREIDCENLPLGLYYLRYDNKDEEVIIRNPKK